jgi:hypothetical protein
VAGGDRQHLPERRVNARLGRQVVVDVRGQVDRQVLEVLVAVAAARERRCERHAAEAAAGVFLDIVRVHQRDDQAEGLVTVVGIEEVDRALAVELVVGAGATCRRTAAVDEAPVVVDRAATEV